MKGIVFDWDGTLADIDEREVYCINQALATANLGPISRDFYIQNYYRRAYEVGSGPRMVLEAAGHNETIDFDSVMRRTENSSPTQRARLSSNTAQ